jgi:hypothetical protein
LPTDSQGKCSATTATSQVSSTPSAAQSGSRTFVPRAS